MGCGRLGPIGSGRLEGRILDLLGRDAGMRSGFKSFWPTCGVGVEVSEAGSSVCDPEFVRKFDWMLGLLSEKLWVQDCVWLHLRGRFRRPALR